MNWADWFRHAPTTVRIAPLEARHAPRLAEIHASAFARPWTAQDFEGFLAERSILGDGLFVDRAAQPAGFVLSRRAADEAEILSVAVAREARGRGHAHALLASHLQALAHAGVGTVHLEVEDGNAPAMALYRRLGFKTVGRREGYYVRPDGSRVAAVSMSLKL
jgi:[ribosomal protein S18]-alanine N-acetyltransferase